MKQRAKKWLWNLVRLAICAAALWYVARGVSLDDRVFLAETGEALTGTAVEQADHVELLLDNGTIRRIPYDQIARDESGAPRIVYGLATVWRTSNPAVLLLSVLAFLPVPILQGIRMKLVLRAQDINMGLWSNIKIAFAGNFWNFAAPVGSTTGDVVKAYYLSLHTHLKTEAVTTVFLDRIIGLVTLVGVVAILATLAPSDSMLAEFRLYTLTFLGLGAVAAFAYLSPTLRRWFVPRRLLSRLPKFDQLLRIDMATRTLATHKTILVKAVAITVVLQAIAVASYFIVAIALGMQAHAGKALEYYAYYSAGAVVQALPGPPQGLGTVELAYSYFFREYGSPSQIVCMALAIRIVVLAAALPGLLVVLSGGYRPDQADAGAHIDALPTAEERNVLEGAEAVIPEAESA